MKNFIQYFIAAAILVAISSCVKEKFSAPPATNTDPNLTPNTTIAALMGMYTGSPVLVTQDLILEAVVVGDDKSGNLYKQVVIEDSTGGIILMINQSDLYTVFPVGRRLFISLKGLYIVQYGGAFEIAASVSGASYTGIAPASIYQYITPGKWGISVAPKVISVTQLLNNVNTYQSQLIELDNVEFITGSRGVPYANGTYQLSASLNIKDCNENQVTVYTSGYADFANSLTPRGNGKMVCIAGVYNAAAQLTVRDTTDLNMTGTVCP